MANLKIQRLFFFIIISALIFSTAFCDWQKTDEVCRQVNDTLMGETILSISVDAYNNLWVLSQTVNGEKFISVNGKKIWCSRYAKPGEPIDLKSISASSVKNWVIKFSSEIPGRLSIDKMDGTLWVTTYGKGLFRFAKGSDGAYSLTPTWKGNVMEVCSGVDGETWILCDEIQAWPGFGWQLYRLNESGSWEKKAGNQIFLLAIADKNNVWSITNPRQIYKWNPGGNNWNWTMNAAECKMISAGPSGLWDLIHVGWTYKWEGSNWTPKGGINVRQITAGNKLVYSMTSALYDKTAVKGAFQLLPLANIYEVYVLHE